MKVVNEAGTYYLDENGQRITLTPSEIKMFKVMTPLGRKTTLRKRAKDMKLADPEGAKMILSLARLPASEWNFPIPD